MEDKVKVTVDDSMFGISSGQIAVFCQGEIVLGGGWIC